MQGIGKTINLSQAYKDTNYIAITNPNNNTDAWPISYVAGKYTTGLIIDGTGDYTKAARTIIISWRTEGYIR